MKKERNDTIPLSLKTFLEIVMGFWENITGFTLNRLAADKMPENVKLVHSIKNHLKQLINMPKGSNMLKPDMGVEDIPDTLIFVPSWTTEFSKSLLTMIKKYEKRIEEIYLGKWDN